EEMTKKAEELKEKIKEAETFEELKNFEKELEESDIYEEAKEKLEEMLEAKEEEAKEELKKEIEKMRDEGFITEEEAERLLKELEDDKIENFEKVEKQLEHESALYNEYEGVREEVMPLVDEWFQFFADRLPRIEEVDHSEDTRTMRGRFDRRSIARPRNLLFGTTQNPLIVRDSLMPRFMASLVIDISGSMSGRMRDARKLLIFFSELFDKISEKYGYIKFSISAFDTAVELIKDFDQEYGSPKRYEFGNGEKTVKVRLMEMTMARGGTDMGKAVWEANKKLNEEKLAHPEYLSALYTISDGETGGELAGERLRRFMDGQESFWGEWWGQHMKCGFMLGPEHTRGVLAQYFGDDNAEAVPDIRDLIEKVMNRFDEDVQDFIRNLPD
ncbi:MAG: vWA domain-containing protein, partial [Patescibacteria group bacterium]